MAGRIDLRRELRDCYSAGRDPALVQVPELSFLMVDGHGDPNTAQEYADAVSALYPVAYALKFASKEELGRDYVVLPLEALWWATDLAVYTSARDKSRWQWTAMIMVPDWLGRDEFDAAMAEVAAKKRPAGLDKVRLETLEEGRCVQTLHVGPYDEEADVLARMHQDVIPSAGLQMTGKHHEIYLSDPRRVAPAKLRTILRQPVEPAETGANR